MKTYWLGVRDKSGNKNIRGPFTELNDALRETKFFTPYVKFEFIVFPLRSARKQLAIIEADRIWGTPTLLEDHIVEGWAGYIGKPEYGTFKCRNCGAGCHVWRGSDSYKHQLCAKCLDKEVGPPPSEEAEEENVEGAGWHGHGGIRGPNEDEQTI